MELLQFFPKEVVAPSHKSLGFLYVVKSGRLRITDEQNNGIAIYGPGMAVGLNEILLDRQLPGTLIAERASTVLALEKSFLLADLDGVEDHIKHFFSCISDAIAKRAVMA